MHPLLMPARRAAQVVTIHDLYFLDRPEHAPPKSAAITRRSRAITPTAPMPWSSTRSHTTGAGDRRLGVPATGSRSARPGAPDWAAPRGTRSAGSDPLYRNDRAAQERRRALASATRSWRAGSAMRLSWCSPGRMTAGGTAGTRRRSSRPSSIGIPHAGYVDAGESRRLYRQASMLVLPSFDEGFGIPALEAMAMGVPVIAANRGALPEVLGDAGMLVDPDEPADIARCDAPRPCTMRRCGGGWRTRGSRARAFHWTRAPQRLYDDVSERSAAGGAPRERCRSGSGSTHANCWETRQASGAIWASCCGAGSRATTRAARVRPVLPGNRCRWMLAGLRGTILPAARRDVVGTDGAAGARRGAIAWMSSSPLPIRRRSRSACPSR